MFFINEAHEPITHRATCAGQERVVVVVLALGVFDFGTDDEVVELDPPMSSDGRTDVVVSPGNSSGVSVVTVEPRGSRTTGMSALESQIVWNSTGSPCWLTMNPSIVGGSV